MPGLPEGIERATLPVRDLRFDALVAGPTTGRTVLLLHGFPQTAWSFRRQMADLAAAGYRAVAPDQRGYSSGARPDDVADYAIDHLVADVLAIADETGAHQFDLVGHDWGGAVAWAVAARYPDRLRTLTALATPHPAAYQEALGGGDTDQASRASYVQFFRQEDSQDLMLANDATGLRGLYVGSGMPEEDAAVYLEAMKEPGRLRAALNWYRANDIGNAELGAVAVPTMYVWSSDDVALGPDAAHATAKHVTGPYRFEVLDGASHWQTEARPAEVTALLLDHLGSAG